MWFYFIKNVFAKLSVLAIIIRVSKLKDHFENKKLWFYSKEVLFDLYT